MLRVIFQYEGKNKGAPTVAVEAATEDEAVDQFCEIKKVTLRRFAMKDWVYDCYEAKRKAEKPILNPHTADGREKRYHSPR